jgi:hypothetical protein
MKATSKAARRRNRRITLAKAEPVPQPPTQGARRDLDPDPAHIGLAARCRQAGMIISEANMQAVKDPIFAHPAGFAIAKLAKDKAERDRMRDALFAIIGAYHAYCRSIGKSPFASVMKIEFLAERFEARADDRPDLRTQQERDVAAAKKWRAEKARIEALGRSQSGALWDGVMVARDMTREGKPTTAGEAFVHALRAFVSA